MHVTKFKVGDKVRITRDFTDEEFPKIGSFKESSHFIGCVGRIENYDDYFDGYRIDGMDNWWWPGEVLELVDDGNFAISKEQILRTVAQDPSTETLLRRLFPIAFPDPWEIGTVAANRTDGVTTYLKHNGLTVGSLFLQNTFDFRAISESLLQLLNKNHRVL